MSRQTIQNKLESLSEQVKELFPGTTTKLEIFPSGAAMLDVRRHERLFVVDYSLAHGFAVDEIGTDEGFNTGYRFLSKDFDSAAEELQRLLQTVTDELQR